MASVRKCAHYLGIGIAAFFGLTDVAIAEAGGDLRLSHLVAPAFAGLTGLVAGLLLQRRKEIGEEQRIYLESRMRLWLDTARAFSEYLISWERLVAIAKLEQTGGGLSDMERDRKNEYVRSRSDARQRLNVCLEQAVLFFGARTLQYIEDFQRFDEKHRVAKLEDLPPVSEWRSIQRRVLQEMKREVRK